MLKEDEYADAQLHNFYIVQLYYHAISLYQTRPLRLGENGSMPPSYSKFLDQIKVTFGGIPVEQVQVPSKLLKCMLCQSRSRRGRAEQHSCL